MANGGNGEGGFQRSPNTYSGDRGGPAEDEALLAELRAISMKSGRSRFAEGTTNDDDDGNGNGNGDADEIAEIAEIGGVATRGGGDRTAPRSTAAADEGFCAVARNCDDEVGGGEIAPLEKGNETPDIPDGSARHDGDRADDDIADAPSLERIDGLIIEGGGGSMPLRRIPLPAIGGAMRWTTICWQSSRRFPSGRLVKIASTAMVRATMERRPMI